LLLLVRASGKVQRGGASFRREDLEGGGPFFSGVVFVEAGAEWKGEPAVGAGNGISENERREDFGVGNF